MKAILIVDIPDELKYEELYFDGVIRYTNNEFNSGYKFLKETGRCLLKPLPDKIDQGYPCEKYDEGYSDGWDECIETILGAEE